MKSAVEKHSIVINGRKTSVSLEDAFWCDLKQIALAQEATLSELIGKIDRARQQSNLSSAIRQFVLGYFQLKRFGVAGTVYAAVDSGAAHALHP